MARPSIDGFDIAGKLRILACLAADRELSVGNWFLRPPACTESIFMAGRNRPYFSDGSFRGIISFPPKKPLATAYHRLYLRFFRRFCTKPRHDAKGVL